MVYGWARLAVQLAVAGLRHRARRRTVAERVAELPAAGLPVSAPVDICWNDSLVPFIEAQSDRDLAVSLGLVHAHLRLAQMELLRCLAHGRLSAWVGPVGVGIDHALRLLDPARAVPEILRRLPDETRAWLDGFALGINHHLASAAELPLELRLLGVAPPPWSVSDLLAVARLAAADVNWLLWMRLMRLPRGPDWPQLWARVLAEGAAPLPSLAAAGGEDEAFARLLLGLGRSGSNAAAVSGRHSASGRAWVFGDPHLSVMLPNLWLAAAYRSPSYHLAGLMIPGIPVMAIGRNPWIAWGGTNLHAASSDLVDVGDLPPGAIVERRVRLPVRWSRPRELVLRETEHGPVVSDAPIFGGARARTLALRWVGHAPSDEISSLLAINRARDWDGFSRAAEGFAIPGQTFVFAGEDGRVGRRIAAWLPRRAQTAPADLVLAPSQATGWRVFATSSDLPAQYDPPRGFVVSANERPPAAAVPVGWLFSLPDRAERLAALLQANPALGLEAIRLIQRDTLAASALSLRDRLCAAAPAAGARARGSDVLAALRAWDGRYETGSPGALAYELVLHALARRVTPPAHREVFGTVWSGRGLLARDIEAVAPERLGRLVLEAAAQAARGFRRFRVWGAVHRLRLAHPLGAVPLLGRRFRFADRGWPGGNNTLLKSGHGLVAGRHRIGYGSNARYVFDLSDLDANRVVLLGDQDGAPGSAAFLDQAEMFARGDYIALPLRPQTARREFRLVTGIAPAPA